MVFATLTMAATLPGCGFSGTIESIGSAPVEPRVRSQAVDLEDGSLQPVTPTTDPLDPTERWLLDLEASGTELPGGGTEMFPDRRLIANYGSPVTGVLGTLGERSPEANIEQLTALAAEYEASMPAGQTSPPSCPPSS